MNGLAEIIADLLERVRSQRPLLHHLTTGVTINDVANVTLAVGALPVMAYALEEVTAMAEAADALVLNLGTPTRERLEAMVAAGHRANERGIPVVLDPVGVGATPFRTDAAQRLLAELEVAIVRGNAGEIGTLAGMGGRIRGVEAVEGGADPVATTIALAQAQGTVVALTGARDIVADGRRVMAVDNGHPLLKAITGAGCMATTVVAAFAAVEPDRLLATAGGLVCFGLAAELAAAEAKGPGSFKVALFDALHSLSAEEVRAGARVEWL
ncbi:MAG TPA: hydroxyethylthiazole kinase [Anaerolineae bacterium]|nr:hydroxyethylthiazole kinase [Anaerolineae bacterium]